LGDKVKNETYVFNIIPLGFVCAIINFVSLMVLLYYSIPDSFLHYALPFDLIMAELGFSAYSRLYNFLKTPFEKNKIKKIDALKE